MVRHMKDLGEMALQLVLLVPEVAVELHHGLERALQKMEATARSEFGVYQDEQGPFPGWPELAEATKDDRIRKGYSENDPLLREGDLRDSFGHEVKGLEGAMGSTSELMPYHEFGTDRMPARPVVGPAAFRDKEVLQKLVGAALVTGLIGPVGRAGPVLPAEIHSALGYNIKTAD